MSEECWKDVINFEGIYQVSNLGRVRSLKHNNIYYLNPCVGGKKGNQYKFVVLQNMELKETWRVHKLVAIHFIENPNNYPLINHKDEDTFNNCVSNLEWCTYSYNQKYNGKSKKIGLKLRGRKELGSKEVVQLTMDGIYICEYISIQQAAISIGKLNNASPIMYCCNKTDNNGWKRVKAYGYKWMYKEEFIKLCKG